MVLVPYAGKYFGRKCAYWGVSIYSSLGDQGALLIGTPNYEGWARFMEWKYPSVEVVFTSKQTFNVTGAVEAAASL